MKFAKYLMIVVVTLTLGIPVHAGAAEEIVFLVSPTPSVDILIKKIPEFTKATDIKIRVESIAYETMMEKEILDLKTKQGTYDVCWIEAPSLERYYKLGGLADINALAKELNLDLSDLPQGLVDSFSYDGALEFMIALKACAPAGTLSYTWIESATAFQQGDVGMEVLFPDWTAAMIDPKESKVVGKWAYAPIPGTGHVASGGYAWAVNGYSKQQKEAMQFAYWATSKDVQMDLAPAGATLSIASVMNDPSLNAKYPHLAVLGESAKRDQPPMKIAPYSELLDVITQGLSEALSGGKPVVEALKKVNGQWAEILKNNGYIK